VVNVTVTEVNDPPTADPDSYTTAEDTALVVPAATGVLANDQRGPVDPEGTLFSESAQSLSVDTALDQPPAHGIVAMNADGSFTYTPDADFNGTDSFTYKVWDNGTTNGAGDPRSATATVHLTITAVNDPPVAGDDSKRTGKNTPLVISAGDLLANDSAGPADESDQTLTITDVGAAVNGEVNLSEGTVTFTPATDFSGAASFTYTVCDNGAPSECDSATVTIMVTASGRYAVVTSESGSSSIIDLQTYTASPIAARLAYGASVTPDGSLGVTATFDGLGTLELINLATTPATIAGTIIVPAILNPESTAITPDGRFAVVADGGGETDAVSVDLQTRTVVNTVSGLTGGNQGVAITPDGAQALILGALTNELSVLTISPAGVLQDTGQRVALGGLVGGPRSIVITPNGRVALITNTGGVVHVVRFDGTSWVYAATVANMGSGASGVAITPDGTTAYVSATGTNQISVLTIAGDDTVTDTAVRITIPGGTPATFFGSPGLAVTPDGTRLLIASYPAAVISMVDTATNTVLPQTIALGGRPRGIGMPPP
jgi:YVTN family beta-propeller protein